jgi:uncharacterized protein (TIGR00369 family)
MAEIMDENDPWLNDTTEYQRCFVCGQRNPCGLHVKFAYEDGHIIANFTGDEQHQGFPGVVHGGVLASLLDETMGRVTVPDHQWVMTARLELRYRAPAPVGIPLRITAEATDIRARLVRVHGWITPQDDPSQILCEADGTFLPLPAEVSKLAVDKWPGLAEFFFVE